MSVWHERLARLRGEKRPWWIVSGIGFLSLGWRAIEVLGDIDFIADNSDRFSSIGQIVVDVVTNPFFGLAAIVVGLIGLFVFGGRTATPLAPRVDNRELREYAKALSEATPSVRDSLIIEDLRILYRSVGDSTFTLAWDILQSMYWAMQKSGQKDLSDAIRDGVDMDGTQRMDFARALEGNPAAGDDTELQELLLAFYEKYRRIVKSIRGLLPLAPLDVKTQERYQRWQGEHSDFMRLMRETVARTGFEYTRGRLEYGWEAEI